jgi:predicted RNA-binding Zn ribbon-like protein
MVETEIQAHDATAPAEGDLEILQRFVNLHQHAPGTSDEIPASTEMFKAFLVERGLLDAEERFGDADRETAIALSEAMHARVRAITGEPLSAEHIDRMDRVAQAAGLHPHFRPEGPVLVPEAGGVKGAFGRIVAIAFHAELDGRWEHLKECADEDCSSVFFDRSKNHSGRWCSMQSCGNRNKVRAWRERQKTS